MNLTRIIITVSCFFLFVTAVSGLQPGDVHIAFISEASASATVSSGSDMPAGLQASGFLSFGGSIVFPPGIGIEARAGVSGTSASPFRGAIGYAAYAGFFGALEVLWEPSGGRWGCIAGPRADFMTLTLSGHTFFFPSLSGGVYLTLPSPEDASWTLRLCFRHTHHFRKDIPYASSTGIGLAFLQKGGALW